MELGRGERMAGTPVATHVKTPNTVGWWHRRAPFAGFVETWWVRIPGKLRPYSRILWAAWADGTYLTAWPRAATILPLAALLLGLTAGATHLSPLTIADSLSSSIPAVAFLQMVPLLFLGVFLGSLSANLGLTLVLGYGLGDLIAGPALTAARPGLLSTLFELRVPQLLSYALFFGLVVTPLVLSNTLLSPLYRRISAGRLPGALLRMAASATVMMLLVYGWTLMAPFALRVMWSWPGQIPPVTPSYFRNTLNPWLPLVAGVAVVLRAVLTWRTRRAQPVVERIARLRRDAERADQNLKWTRRCPPWARSIATAAASTLLTAAMLSTWVLATLVFFGFLLLDFLRRTVLPRVGLWKWWTSKVMIAPLILRLGASVVLTYFITLELLQMPGWAASANGIPGQFGAELASLALGVMVTFFLMPATHTALPDALTPATLPRSAMRATAVMMLLACALFATPGAFAICLDPSCCFGDNPNAALAVAAMGLGLGGMGMGPDDDTGDDGGNGGGPVGAAGGEGGSQGGAAGSGDGGGGGGGASDAAGGEGASEGAAAAGGGGASDAAGGLGASEGEAAAGGDGGAGGGAADAAGDEGASEGAAAGSGEGEGAGDGSDESAQAQAQAAAAQAQAEGQAAAWQAEQEAAQAQAQAEADAAMAQAQAQAAADAQANAQAQAQLAAAEAQAEAQAAAQLAEQQAAQAQAQAEADAALAQAQASASQNSTSGNTGGSGSSNPDISNYEEEKPLKNPNDP
jgi:hypothetical protein